MRNQQKQIQLRDVQDVMYVIGGRWRSAILASLCDKVKGFNELKRDLGTITPRTLSKELKFLEQNLLIKQSDALYRLTDHGHSLEPLIVEVVKWGQKHRKVILANYE